MYYQDYHSGSRSPKRPSLFGLGGPRVTRPYICQFQKLRVGGFRMMIVYLRTRAMPAFFHVFMRLLDWVVSRVLNVT